MTDYIALPVPFSDGTTKLLAVATRSDGGFADEEIAAMRDPFQVSRSISKCMR